MIVKTTKEAICGGYTSKGWSVEDEDDGFSTDNDAFVFNMT